MMLLRHTATVSGLTGVSRLLGFAREVVMANLFGTSLAKSAFDVAFRIPNLFRNLFGEGALSAAFVPVFADTLSSEGRDAANRLSGRVLTLLAAGLILITAAGTVAVSVALPRVAPDGRAAAVLPLLRIMLPYTLFICMTAICMGILNAVGHFAVPAATPIILNLAWIGSVLLICPRLGDTPAMRIRGVAWTVLAAGVLQLAVQAPILLRLKVWPRVSWHWNTPRIRRILALLGPTAVGMGAHQLNVLIDGLLALWAGTWAPAALAYAERLVYLPLGVFATALGTVLLPAFSTQVATGRQTEIPETLSRSLTAMMLVMTPAAAGLALLAPELVRLFFQGGRFDVQSTLLTARALRVYAFGLLLFSLCKLLPPAFYAIQDTRTPIRAGLLAVGLNLILNITFVTTFPTGFKHVGLALATVLSSALQGTLLAHGFHRRFGSPGWRVLAVRAGRILGCTAWMLAGIRLALAATAGRSGFSASVKTGQAATVGLALATGLTVYGASVFLFARREWRLMRGTNRRKGHPHLPG